jgi:hypothetical protein
LVEAEADTVVPITDQDMRPWWSQQERERVQAANKKKLSTLVTLTVCMISRERNGQCLQERTQTYSAHYHSDRKLTLCIGLEPEQAMVVLFCYLKRPISRSVQIQSLILLSFGVKLCTTSIPKLNAFFFEKSNQVKFNQNFRINYQQI